MKKGLEKRVLGRTGAKVSFIGFGALEIGRNWGIGSKEEQQRPKEEEATKVINSVIDLGINLIDTASAYHKSEERIGKAVSNRCNKFFLASKCGEHNDEPQTYYDFSYRAVKESIDLSLERLKVDTIDLMQIHFGPDEEKVLDEGETLAAMKDAQDEGKIRFLGASCNGHVAKRCVESGDFDVIQMYYNIAFRKNKKIIDLCGKNNIGVLIRGGLACGALTSRVIPHIDNLNYHTKEIKALLDLVDNDTDKLTSLALNFLYKDPNISSVLVGSKNLNHIKDNFQYLEKDISEELLAEAIKVTE